jgi:hypothetical protein
MRGGAFLARHLRRRAVDPVRLHPSLYLVSANDYAEGVAHCDAPACAARTTNHGRFHPPFPQAPVADRAFAEEAGVKAGLLINGARTMLTGQAVGPSMFEIFDIIGRDASVQRLRSGIPWQ